MAQSFDSSRDRATGRPNVGAIEKGWSVYDSLERPIGNVTDVEDRLLRIDGRPEGIGFVEVPLSRIESTGDGEVRLSVSMEAITGDDGPTTGTVAPSSTTTPSSTASPTSTATPYVVAGSASTTPVERTTMSEVTVTSARGQRTGDHDTRETDGSSSTASGAPVTLGSQAAVDNDSSEFHAWEDEVAEESTWSKWGGYLGGVLLLALGLGGYAWWRRRQARKTPIERMRHVLETAGESVEPALEIARERPRAAGLASLVGLLLLRYLLSSDKKRPTDKDAERAVDRAKDGAQRATGSVLEAGGDAKQGAANAWRAAGSALKDTGATLKDTGGSLMDSGLSLKDRLGERLSDRAGKDTDQSLLTRLAGLSNGSGDDTAYAWRYAIPAAVAGAGAWYVLRGRSQGNGTPSDTRRLGDIMTGQVKVLRPEASVAEAATTMKSLDVGVLPICDGRRLQGMVTDRDIVIRTVAEGRDPQSTKVRDVMSDELVYAFEDDSIERGAELMRRHQIRRLPIVDRDKNLAGIVSLGDLATDGGNDALSGETLEKISS